MEDPGTAVSHHPNCGRCSAEHCPADQRDCEPSIQGWRLGLGALAVFVLPLLLAVAGAVGGNVYLQSELIGAAMGLTVGMLAVFSVARLLPDSEAAP